MRGFTLAGILVIAVFAGCLRGPEDPGTPVGPGPLYAPDCSISNWADPCVARASPNDSPSKTEIDLAVNPKDPLNVIVGSKDNDRLASGCVWSVAQWTKDGGKTWTTSYVGGRKSQRQPGQPLHGWGCITDPILAFDKDGWAYYGLQAYNAATESNEPPNPCLPPTSGGTNSGSAFYLARSRDGGATWDRIIPLHAGEGNVIFHDYPRMAANPATNGVFVIWNEFDTAGLPCNVGPTGMVGTGMVRPVVAGSRDRGENPMQPVYLIPANHPKARYFGINGFAIAKSGKMYAALTTPKDVAKDIEPTAEVWLTTSTDDARTWTAPVKVFEITEVTRAPGQGRAHTPTTRFRINSAVELAVDATDGNRTGCVYAAWVDNGTGNADILSRRSCDEGRTWSEPVRVNEDNTTGYQLMTRNVVSGDGVLHVGYITQAYDPGLKLFDGEHAFSEDGGATWTTGRLTAVSFDGDKGIHQDGGPFFGDYNGIGASGNHVYFGFPDSLTGVAEIAVAHIVRG